MSRKTGGRPGYGWSMRQQGGFRPPGQTNFVYTKGSTKPTAEHNLKSNLSGARKEGWSVRSECENCGRNRTIAAFELIQLYDLSPTTYLKDISTKRASIPCPDCKMKNKTSFSYVI